MRPSLPSRVLAPLAVAGVAVCVAIATTALGGSEQVPLAALGLAAAAMALTLAQITRQVLQPLEVMAAALDPDDAEATEAPPAGGAEQLAALADRSDAVGRVAAAAVAHAARASALEAEHVGVARSLATTMSDVARRELALVNRLLDQLDVLERNEADPARLEQLYVLDHLAVRLRGQSENLLVVADAAPAGDPDEPPMAAVDLIRLAASQAEDYGRVVVDADVAGQVVGWAARPLAQLLAALLDNGLRYSPPSQPVVVTGLEEPTGLVLHVRDHGIGMDDAALAAAAATIEQPPLLEAARSQRLGLYVVGVLARRLGVEIRIDRAADAAGGILVTIAIPRALLAGAAGAVTPAADRAAAAWHVDQSAVPPSPPGASPDVVVDLAAELGWVSAPVAPLTPPAPPVPDTATPAAVLPDAAPPGPPAAPPAPAAAEEPPSRRRRRRAEVAWSIALQHGGEHPVDHSAEGPDPRFVNDVSTWSAQTPATPAPWLMTEGPSMPSRPVTVPTGSRIPTLDEPVHLREPDDYIPPIVDNPLLDILPSHPTAHLTPVLPAAANRAAPEVLAVPEVLDGIRVVRADAPVVRAPQDLPSRRAADPAETTAQRTPLFARGAATPAAIADDPAEFSALAGLIGVDEELPR